MRLFVRSLTAALILIGSPAFSQNDSGYGAKIKEFTTDKAFITELVDHLPASSTVPSPEKHLGHIVGAPGFLTYTKDLHAYFRLLAKATPRVKVLATPEKSEEGKEQLLVLVSDEANLADLDRYKAMTARLADPRKTSDAEAAQIIKDAKPFYWASGSIHSPETGSCEMLMELAYRLVVDESPFYRNIRKNLIVMITPALEVDGRDRMVDRFYWHKANPDKPMLPFTYWGHYAAHDNNRDSMGMALALSRNQMATFLDYHPQVLHDLHESVPFLYISTGTGPYNAWLDPITIDEWHQMAYHEVGEMTRRGVIGVWTHGFYDGWAPNYMFYVANGHNSIGRFYETFGNSVADTMERTVGAQAQRAWYRPNPPLPKVKWSLRNNVNMQQSALLIGMTNVADNRERFLENFYTKSKRSVAKAATEGPAAWVIPAGDRPTEAADMVNSLRSLGVEVQTLSSTFTPAAKGDDKASKPLTSGTSDQSDSQRPTDPRTQRPSSTSSSSSIPAGSYVIRMDQPYSRLADMLLDVQYYNPSDPRPYDDTGWTMGLLRNMKTIRVTDKGILAAPMVLLGQPASPAGGIQALTPSPSPNAGRGEYAAVVVNNTAENRMATLRYALKDAKVEVAEEPFKVGERSFNAGTNIIKDGGAKLDAVLKELGLTGIGLAEAPKMKTHPIGTPRLALVHTWTNTQDEGWFRYELDKLKIPYDYVSVHELRDNPNLHRKFDVILFPPSGDSAQDLINGIPMRGEAMPWKGSKMTPNFALGPDQSDDIRGGIGHSGVVNLKHFVEDGGLFIAVRGVCRLPVEMGFLNDVSIETARNLVTAGSIYNTTFEDRKSPISYGYGESLAVYFNQSPLFRVARIRQQETAEKPSGRGSPSEPDLVQGREAVEAPKKEADDAEPTDEQKLFGGLFLTPKELRPRVVLRFAKEEKNLLASGMLSGGSELANRPAVVDCPLGKGHIVLFANNPMWRHTTQGSFSLLFNAILNWDHLDAGRK